MRILVAEDLEADVEVLRMAFSKAGVDASLYFVRDGQEVIDYLKEAGSNGGKSPAVPTMLLLDLKMPRLGGFDVLEWLRSQPNLRRLVVVVFTSSSFPEDINRAYDLGANSYVVKPGAFPSLVEIAKNLERYWLKINQSADCGEAARRG